MAPVYYALRFFLLAWNVMLLSAWHAKTDIILIAFIAANPAQSNIVLWEMLLDAPNAYQGLY